jgi:hypothetical protein
MYVFQSLQDTLSLWPELSHKFLFHGVTFAALSKSSCLNRVCLALHCGGELGWVIFRISLPEALLFAEPRGKGIFLLKKVLIAAGS